MTDRLLFSTFYTPSKAVNTKKKEEAALPPPGEIKQKEDILEADIEDNGVEEESRAQEQSQAIIASAAQFFERDGDKEQLVAKTTEYRASSQRNKQQRFVLMYSAAYYEIFKKPMPSKDHVIEASKRSNLHDRHISTYFDDMLNKHLSACLHKDGCRRLWGCLSRKPKFIPAI